MIVPILLFVLGLVFLINGGDWFVDGSCGVARRFHLPEVLIGATVVSIGTTIPEVMVSSIAAAEGMSATAYGNAIGSIICNTALVAAITMAVRPQPCESKSLRLPVIFFFIAAVIYSGVAIFTGHFSRVTGIILLCGFIVYISINVKKAISTAKNSSFAEQEKEAEVSETEETEVKQKKLKDSLFMDIAKLIVGAAVIAIGANLLVNNGTKIARMIGVPETVIALTFVALGTSLPELVTAITALTKGHSDLSLGNIIGANLFNLVFVSGMAVTIRPFDIPAEKTIMGMNASMVIDIPLMFIVMLIMTIPALKKGKIYRAQGITLLAIYVAYVIFQFFI